MSPVLAGGFLTTKPLGKYQMRFFLKKGRTITKVNPSLLSVQFSSVTQLCPILCDPMNCSMTGLPVHHQLLEFTQTYVH